MNVLKCELCGSNEFVKQDEFIVCKYCKTKYTPEAPVAPALPETPENCQISELPEAPVLPEALEKIEKYDERRYDQAKKQFLAYLEAEVSNIPDPSVAKTQAKALVEQYKEDAAEQAEEIHEKVLKYQKVEFVIGAAVILTVLLLWIQNRLTEPMFMIIEVVLIIAYVVVAIIDSRTKGKRKDAQYKNLAAQKVKFNTDGGKLNIEFGKGQTE